MTANDLVYDHVSGNNLWSHPSTGKTSKTLGEITQTTFPNIELFSGRLAPSLEWSPGLGSPGQTNSYASSETGALLQRKFLQRIRSIISGNLCSLWTKQQQTKLFITLPSYMNACTSVRWLHELQSFQFLWWSTSLYFKGTGRHFPCKV